MATSANAMNHQSAEPMRQALLRSATALLPFLRENAERAERDRRLPDENVAALRERGFLRLWQPRRLGGLEVDQRTYLDVTAELARGCASSSWYAFILNGTAWLVGLMSDAAQRDVWAADPDALVCSQLEPTGQAEEADGGIRISGRWGFASACYHADWSLLGYPVLDRDGQIVDQGLALVPMSALVIEDTWYVTGMCGTGSNTVVGNGVYVPRHRSMHLSQAVAYRYPTEHIDESLYRSSFAPTCTLCPSAPIYGMARAALEVTLERLEKSRKKVAYTMVRDTRQMPTTQLALAQASVLIDTAYLHARDVADSIDAVARTGKEMDVADRSRNRMKVGHAMRCAREAVDRLLDVQGASSFALSNPLQRIWRDISAASRHGLLNADNIHSIYGRTMLGLPDPTTPLV